MNNTDRSVADVLVATFNIQDPDPNRTFLLAYTAITRMLESSQMEVEKYLNPELSFYGVHFRPLRACFNPKVSHAAWNTYKANLNPNDVTGIRHTAQRLRSIVPEYEAHENDLADILTTIQEMSEALDNEVLSEHSRETLRACLDEIKRAVDEYRIWGSAGINSAFKVFTGTLVTDQTLQADLRRESASGGSLWKKVAAVGGSLVMLLAVLNGMHDLKHNYLPFVEKLILPQKTITGPTIEAKPVPGESPKEVHDLPVRL